MSHIITTYGPWAIFALVLFEDFGLFIVPGETALISAGLLASHGKMSIEWLLIAAWAGAVLGDTIGYFIGRLGGRRLVLRYGSRFGATHYRLLRVERFFARYGSFIVVFARFFFGLRQLNGIVAGIGIMPSALFVLYNAIGAALWVAVWGFGVYLFGHQFTNLIQNLLGSMNLVLILALVGLAVLAVIAFFWWRRRHNASQAE